MNRKRKRNLAKAYLIIDRKKYSDAYYYVSIEIKYIKRNKRKAARPKLLQMHKLHSDLLKRMSKISSYTPVKPIERGVYIPEFAEVKIDPRWIEIMNKEIVKSLSIPKEYLGFE